MDASTETPQREPFDPLFYLLVLVMVVVPSLFVFGVASVVGSTFGFVVADSPLAIVVTSVICLVVVLAVGQVAVLVSSEAE